VIGVIEPGADAAAAASRTRKAVVIGTEGTVSSHAYQRALAARGIEAREQACPLFVPLVEEGWTDHPVTEQVAHIYLDALFKSGPAGADVMVLGCTHYPLLKPLLQRVMGPGVTLIDSAQETAAELARVLEAGCLAAPASRPAVHRFAVSDDQARFRQVGARFIGERLGSAELVPMG